MLLRGRNKNTLKQIIISSDTVKLSQLFMFNYQRHVDGGCGGTGGCVGTGGCGGTGGVVAVIVGC